MRLLDVSVWLAAAVERHTHHRVAAAWLNEQSDGLVLCRVTQMGLLRLLSNPAVMRQDVVSRDAAWRVVDRLHADDRVVWADETAGLEPVWRAISAQDDNSHKLWTDDYLAAFAQVGDLTFATLDSRFAARYASVRVETLI